MILSFNDFPCFYTGRTNMHRFCRAIYFGPNTLQICLEAATRDTGGVQTNTARFFGQTVTNDAITIY